MQCNVLRCVVVIGLLVTAVPAEEYFDCETAYKTSLELLKRQKPAPDQLAAMSRQALRVYDACQTRDVHDIKALFQRLERSILELKGAGGADTN